MENNRNKAVKYGTEVVTRVKVGAFDPSLSVFIRKMNNLNNLNNPE